MLRLLGLAALFWTLPAYGNATYEYTATLERPASRTGAVTASGIVWQCSGMSCTTRGPWPHPGVGACAALAQIVGPIRDYGHPGERLAPALLTQCNTGAEREAPTLTSRPPLTYGSVVERAPVANVLAVRIPPRVSPLEPAALEAVLQVESMTVLLLQGRNLGESALGRSIYVVPVRAPANPCPGDWRCPDDSFYREHATRILDWNSKEIVIALPPEARNRGQRTSRGGAFFFDVSPDLVASYRISMLGSSETVQAFLDVPNRDGRRLPFDVDGDGHGNFRYDGDDCDDLDPTRYPGATEVPDERGHDEDCNPSTTGDRDADSDGFMDVRMWNDPATFPRAYLTRFPSPRPHARGTDPWGRGTDCNDLDASVHPIATEVCNHKDDNCDGAIDEGLRMHVYRDADHDSFGDPAVESWICPQDLSGDWVANSRDCDDRDVTRNPARGTCPP